EYTLYLLISVLSIFPGVSLVQTSDADAGGGDGGGGDDEEGAGKGVLCAHLDSSTVPTYPGGEGGRDLGVEVTSLVESSPTTPSKRCGKTDVCFSYWSYVERDNVSSVNWIMR
ncbi:hypothetical protein SK128_011622, partial [Halocaridina rubra]